MKLICLVLIVTMPCAVSAQEASNFTSGRVELKIKNMGFTVDGTMDITNLLFKQPSSDVSTWLLEGNASPFSIFNDGQSNQLDGEFTINRLDFWYWYR